jgi:hypothetical protein
VGQREWMIEDVVQLRIQETPIVQIKAKNISMPNDKGEILAEI